MDIIPVEQRPNEGEAARPESPLSDRLREACGTAWDRTLQVCKDTYKHVHNAEVMTLSASLSYITLVSFLPLMAVSFVIFKAFGGMDRLLATMGPLSREVLAPDTAAQLMDGVAELSMRLRSGTLTVTALVALIWSSMILFASVEKGINRVWETEINRSWLRRISAYWMLISLGPLAFVILAGFVTSDNLSGIRAFIPSAAVGFVATAVLVFVIYKVAPDRHVHWLAATVGALSTASALLAARYMVAHYADTVLHSDYYGRIYGGLAVVALLIVLIFVSWVIFLIGASLSVSIQRQIECRLQEDAVCVSAELKDSDSPED